MTSVRIRRALPADAAGLSLLAADTFALACPPGLPQGEIQAFIGKNLSQEAFSGYLSSPSHRLWLAQSEPGSLMLGYLMAVYSEPDNPFVGKIIRHRPTVELSKIYVRPTHHGKGLADLLMATACEDATESGAQSIWLGVNKHNVRANCFYDKHGFRVVGERMFQVGATQQFDFVRELLVCRQDCMVSHS